MKTDHRYQFASLCAAMLLVVFATHTSAQEVKAEQPRDTLPKLKLDVQYQIGHRTSPANLDELFLLPTKEETEAIWNALPQVEGKDFNVLGKWLEGEGWITEHFTYRSNGLLIYGILMHPTAPGKYPLIIENHGGSTGIGVSANPESPAGRADPLWERCIKEGYVVVGTSLRGEQTPAGTSEGEKGGYGEIVDALAVLQLAKKLPYVDPTRIGVMGGSHGGRVSSLMSTRDPDIDVAVCFNGGYDRLNRIDAYPRALHLLHGEEVTLRSDIDLLRRYLEGKLSMQAYRKMMIEESALYFADKINAPVMLLHGELDTTVPYLESVKFYQRLKSLGKTAELRLHLGQSHGWFRSTDTEEGHDARDQAFAFLAKYLKQ